MSTAPADQSAACGDLVIPGAVTIPAALAAQARDTYRLGLWVRAQEITIDRDQDQYLLDHFRAETAYGQLIAAFQAHFQHPDLIRIACTLNPAPAEVLTQKDQAMYTASLAGLQAGYLADLLADLAARGLTGEPAWAHLALQEHPPRYLHRRFFSGPERVRCLAARQPDARVAPAGRPEMTAAEAYLADREIRHQRSVPIGALARLT